MSNILSTGDASSGIPETLPITVEQYETLVNAGVFAGTVGQLELIHGRIVRMNPQGPEHADPVDVLTEWSIEAVQRRFTVRVEKPIRLPEQFSSPEPDIAWVTRRRYSRQHPGPEDIQLVIEVSHSSSNFDSTEKMQLYAAAKIPEYWQVDLPRRVVTIHRDPHEGKFRTVQPCDETKSIHPLCLPESHLSLATLFTS